MAIAVFTLFLAVPALKAQDTLRFLSMNIWQEGTSVPNGLQKIRDVIIAVDPDVVVFAEVRNYNSEDWTTKIVNALADEGHSYYGKFYGGDVSVISKFPILSGHVVISTGPGSVVAYRLHTKSTDIVVAAAHLDYTYYACYLPRGYNGGDPNWKMIDDGTGNPSPVTDTTEILTYDLKSYRDEQIAAFLQDVQNDTVPVFLMGDFNAPSWMDWTARTGSMFDHHGVIIHWPNTFALADSGFTDAFRAWFPDEVRNPGITWPSFATDKGSTSWTPKADERDRIDYIFFKGERLSVAGAALVGPRESYAYNKIDTSYTSHETFLAADLPWPSDHKAVYAEIVVDTTTTFSPVTHAAISFFTVSPNPASGEIRIRLDRSYRDLDVQIYTVDGKRVFEKSYQSKKTVTVPVSQFREGIYLVNICAEGKRGLVKTMIKR